MVSVARPRATYADIEALPPGVNGQILDGELVAMPRPGGSHAGAASNLVIALGGRYGTRRDDGGWVILFEPELHLGSDVIVPDVAGWRRSRMPVRPSEPAFDLVPDWACEIFSPGSRRVDQVVKPPIYARHGLAHLWLVDPQAQAIQTMRLEDRRWILTGGAVGVEEAALEPFEDAPLDLAFVWSD